MSISYVPVYQHNDWVDNVDRVRAAGDNGFNNSFHELEQEFRRIAVVIKKVSEALDELSKTPAPQPVLLTLTPVLASLGGLPWEHVFGGVVKPVDSSVFEASGMMPVTLPHGAVIRELRVCGRKDAGNLSVNLRRQSLAAGSTTELIIGLSLSNGNFDTSSAVPPGPVAKVDNQQFRYYLTAELDGAPGAAVVTLTCFQITYTPS